MDEPRLGVAAAARRLGIAPATLRTWDRRYDLGPTGHAPGHHRRYSPEDIARLELMQRALVRGASPADAARYARSAPLPGPDSAAPDVLEDPSTSLATGDLPPVEEPVEVDLRPDPYGDDGDLSEPRVRVGGRILRLPGAGRRARGLGRAALALDSGVVRAVLRESIAACGVTRTWDEVVRPVLAAVAERWTSTGVGVEIEHLLSDCLLGVLGGHPTATTARSGEVRPVLLAAMPGDPHFLPIVALSAALADRGIACRSLGPDLPVQALVAAVRRTAPAAVVLWSLLATSADADVLRALPRTRLRFRTYVAGPGWGAVALPPRVTRLDSLVSATAAVSAAVLV